MTYFHIRTYTIIGAKSFHCPVRDGKEWDQLAMVIRLKTLAAQAWGLCSQFAESFGDPFWDQSAYLDCATENICIEISIDITVQQV